MSTFVRTPWAVLAIWALYAAIRLGMQPLLGWHPASADDWTRALEVRDLLAGQSWWDVSQHRMNPPQGFSMHWSRLVDLPLAALSATLGETAALALLPLLWLIPALFALRAIMLRLGFAPLAFGFGLALLPLFPLLPGVFAPFAVDHHTPQAVLGLVCAALLLHDSRRAALAAGMVAAAWVVISLEALPLVAALAALYALRYWWAEERLLGWFLGALAVAAPLLSIATRSPAAISAGFCDILLPGHMTALMVAFLGACALPHLPRQGDVRWRVAGLALVGAISLGAALWLLGPCATNPMAALDPVLLHWWHGFVLEGLPVWHQTLSAALVLVWTIGLAGAGWWVAGRNRHFHDGRALAFTLLALMGLAAGGYSLLLYRAGVLAQLLAIPFAALLLAHFLPRARALAAPLPRIAATLACFAFATPVFVSALAKPLDPLLPPDPRLAAAGALMAGPPCDYARLASVPRGVIFAPFDKAPEILARTGHAVVAASYHRNQAPMRAVIAGFIGPVDAAEAVARQTGADYVLACSAEADLALYRTADAANFANALVAGDVPEWLVPVPGFESGSLRLYRVN